MSAVAERVAAIRRYRGLTQEDLARSMQGVGIAWQRVVVAKLESGRRPYLTVEERVVALRKTFTGITRALSERMAEVVTVINTEEGDPSALNWTPTPEWAAKIERFNELPPVPRTTRTGRICSSCKRSRSAATTWSP